MTILGIVTKYSIIISANVELYAIRVVLTNETARSFLVVSVKSSSSQGLIDIFQIPPPPIPLLHMAVTIGVPVYPHIDNSTLLYIAELGNVMFVLNSSIYLTMRGH